VCFVVVICDLYQKVAANDTSLAEARSLLVFTSVWWLYPVVSLVAPVAFWTAPASTNADGDEYPLWLSIFKEITFGVADFASKALFALDTVRRVYK